MRDWIGLLATLYHLFLERRSAKLENLTALHLLKACHYWTDVAPAPSLVKFAAKLQAPHAIQLVDKVDYDRVRPEAGVRVMSYERFLAGLV